MNSDFAPLRDERSAAGLTAQAYLQWWQQLFNQLSQSRVLPANMLEQLSAKTGFPAEMLEAGVRRQCLGWSQPGSEPAQTFAEIDAPSALIIAAGNVPGVAVAPAIMLAAYGWGVRVKLSRHEDVLFPWLLAEMEKLQPAAATGIACYSGRTAALQKDLDDAEHVLVFGSQKTVSQLQAEHPGKVIGFGHKISISVADGPRCDDKTLLGFLQDVLLYNQQGCLSSQVLFCRKLATDDVAGRLFALADEISWAGDTRSGVEKQAIRERLELSGVPFRDHPSTGLLLAQPQVFQPGLATSDRVLQVVAAEEIRIVQHQLAGMRGYLQGCSMTDLRQEIGMGVSYVCAPGQLQAPPLDWPNQGIRLPADLLRESRNVA